jgi:hypothetical protein
MKEGLVCSEIRENKILITKAERWWNGVTLAVPGFGAADLGPSVIN